MSDIQNRKQQKINDLTAEINRKGLELGWDDGSGSFDVLHRLCDETATELEKRRTDKNSVKDELELMKLLHDRHKLQREIDDE